MKPSRPLSPHLQIYKLQYTMVLSISHRITGVLLSIGSGLLIYWLWALAAGEAEYTRALDCLSSGWVRLVLLGLMFSFFYHLANGVRHLAWDLGYGFEKGAARASGWAVVLAAVLLTALGAFLVLRTLGQAVGGEI